MKIGCVLFRWVLVISVFCLTMSSKHLFGDHFPDQIVIIGDSLSDSGNAIPTIPGIFNPFKHTAYTPRTDGVPWSVLIAEKLKTKSCLLPYAQGGTNFAYVGAETTKVITAVPGLLQQVDFISDSVSRSYPVFVWGGANDIFFDGIFSDDAGLQAARNIGTILQKLKDKGFKYFISINLPDLGLLPGIPDIYTGRDTKESADFNRELITQLKNTKFSVIAIDMFSLFEEIDKNFRSYGFTTVTGQPDVNSQSTAGFAFWYDGVHPTQATHRILADYIYSVLSAPKSFAVKSNEAFSVVREQMVGIQQQMAPSSACRQLCRFYPFISGSYSPLLLSEQNEAYSEREGYGGNVVLGVANRFSECWTLGIAGSPSYTIHRNEEDNIKNRYKLTAVSGSLFASYESGCGYFNAIGNVGWLDLNSIKRKFPLGPVDHEAHGSTNGMDYLAQIYGSYFVWNCENRFSTGPKANVEFQRVFIDGYKESGAAIGNIEYKDQDNTSIITGLGWEAKFRIPMSYVSMFGDVFLMFNRQWHSRNRDISIRERSLDVPAGKWPIYTPRFNFASGGINLTTTFSRGVSLGIRYQFNLGTFDIKEHFINLSLTFPI